MDSVNSMSDLKALVGTNGQSVYLLGYYAPRDGGDGVFVYDSASTTTPNDGTVVKPTSAATGRWKRVFEAPVNVRWFGAKGDNSVNDAPKIMAAVEFSKSIPSPVYAPAGVYRVDSPVVTGDFRGLIGDGKTSTTFIAGAAGMQSVIDVGLTVSGSTTHPGMARGELRDFRVDCAGKANIGIKSDFGVGGGSVNNSYTDIMIENYLVTGWQADDNNDCYFDRIFIPGSIYNPGTTAAFRGIAAGGPLQFLNCNFLNEVYVAAQYISFITCVTGGIVLRGPGFNVLHYESGYAFPSPNNGSVVYIAGDGNGGAPSEVGPITFEGSHIEVNENQYLIGGSGRLHYGVNATGCHIFTVGNPSPATQGKIIKPTVTSVYSPAATNKFTTCWFWKIDAATVNGIFRNEYEKCYVDTYFYNEPNYLQITGGDVKNVLGIPGIGEDMYSRANNRFVTGNGDGASYTTYNSILRGHWGMALQSPFGDINGYIDFRLGKIDLKDGFYINGAKLPVLTKFNETGAKPGITGLVNYPDNATALAALGPGKLYHTTGVLKITY